MKFNGEKDRIFVYITLRENYLYLELLWSVFSGIRTECEEILHFSPYLVRMRENTDQNNTEYGHFLRSVIGLLSWQMLLNALLISYGILKNKQYCLNGDDCLMTLLSFHKLNKVKVTLTYTLNLRFYV